MFDRWREERGRKGLVDSGSGLAVGPGRLYGAKEEQRRVQLGGEEGFVLDTQS